MSDQSINSEMSGKEQGNVPDDDELKPESCGIPLPAEESDNEQEGSQPNVADEMNSPDLDAFWMRADNSAPAGDELHLERCGILFPVEESDDEEERCQNNLADVSGASATLEAEDSRHSAFLEPMEIDEEAICQGQFEIPEIPPEFLAIQPFLRVNEGFVEPMEIDEEEAFFNPLANLPVGGHLPLEEAMEIDELILDFAALNVGNDDENLDDSGYFEDYSF